MAVSTRPLPDARAGRRTRPPSARLASSLVAGAALSLGWVGESLLGLPSAAAWGLYGVAYLAGGWDATVHAFRAARRGRLDIDALMLVAALGAGALGRWAEGALLLFLFSLGHALEHEAMDRARDAIRALAGLSPRTARVRRDGREVELAVTELRVGDLVVVRAGERIAADGVVVGGASDVDQAPITGESLPVAKTVDDPVYAGTLNGHGALEIRTTKGPEDTTLARIVQAVTTAQAAKAPSQRMTDRFQRIFTPAVLSATALMIALPPLWGVPFAEGFARAMTLLVAASPCALALATPSAVLAGIARAARSGVLVKGGAYLEATGRAAVVVFDKTGTLSRGKPQVTDVWSDPEVDDRALLSLAAAVESRSGHPLAGAIVRASGDDGLARVDDVRSRDGAGVTALVAGFTVHVGNETLLHAVGVPVTAEDAARRDALEGQGKTVVFVARDQRLIGLIAIRDEPRPEAATTIAALRDLGVRRTVMLTGDRHRVATAIASELGIDEVHAELLPEDKATAIEALRARYGPVVMVGDGVNDAPALVAADVGIAMGGASTDVALEVADVVLMGDDLSALPYAVALSRASRRMIVQNLVVSLGVIALLVPSALLGWASIGVAVVLHESSTLVVVANALRLLRFCDRRAESWVPHLAGGERSAGSRTPGRTVLTPARPPP